MNPNGTTATSVANAQRPGIVRALAQQSDGGLIVGGAFKAANGMERNHLLRVQPDGTLDPDWNPSANSEVMALALALAVDASGAVYAGGNFWNIGGASRQFIAKHTRQGFRGQALPVSQAR